ncbi:MAG: aquaporin [Deltaproteobacteria bacterium]|nr:MAG: aquaporin [Deltaproteobacteria bacterium]
MPAATASAPVTHAVARKAVADGIGTFALVFAGCGAIVVDTQGAQLGHVGVSLVFGLVVAGMIFATGHLSGAHFNPAVTLAFAAIDRFAWRDVPAYLAAQLAGAVLACVAVQGLVGDEALLGTTVPAIPLAQALGVEFLLTFFLMFVITAVATDARAHGQLAAVAIGGTVTLGALMGGPLTGASMNPARSLAPALVSGALAGQWVYLLAPVAGAVAGALTYRWVAAD